MRMRASLFAIVGRVRPFYAAALLLFLAGAALGWLFADRLGAVLDPLVRSLRVEALALRHDTVWGLMFELFYNNLRVSLLMLFGGIAFGLLPAAGALANGALVGYVLALAAARAGVNPLLMLAAGVLPHGIFEIPAYLLASAFGLKLGWLAARSLAGQEVREAWKSTGRELAPAILWVMGLLAVAAAVESTVTPVLLRAAAGGHAPL